MVSESRPDKPTFEEYPGWYIRHFQDDLESSIVEQWYEQVTGLGLRMWEGSEFWRALQENLPQWNTTFESEHQGYSLLNTTHTAQPIQCKLFKSSLSKSFRKNIIENTNWPHPPTELLEGMQGEVDPHDRTLWYSPDNWLTRFSDIFRTRLITTYFDGVSYLAERIYSLAEQTTPSPPQLQPRASHEGYHAVHVDVYRPIDIRDYENSDDVSVRVGLEIQVTTTIQETIGDMLHRVYDSWRMVDLPLGWEWDLGNPAFSVNYLGSVLHYLEGMIVVARDQRGLR